MLSGWKRKEQAVRKLPSIQRKGSCQQDICFIELSVFSGSPLFSAFPFSYLQLSNIYGDFGSIMGDEKFFCGGRRGILRCVGRYLKGS